MITPDWIIVAVVLLSGAVSVVRGFVKEALSLAVWVVAYIVAATFGEGLAEHLTQIDWAPSFRVLLARIILFVAVLILGGIVNFLLGKLVESTGLSGTDRMIGLVFGLFRGFLIVLAVLILLPKMMPVEGDMWWQNSVLIPRFLAFEDWAYHLWSQLLNFLTQW